MKITNINIDGFGVWSGLALDNLSEELNVFCGPNEAGKTTLLQFVRGVLYGFSPERMRYLPPLRGGRPGGELEIASQQGTFRVARHADRTDGNGRATATLIASDGTRQSEPILKEILFNVDELVFKNVFAFGLQEIQQLGSLGDTEAAKLLFKLATGLDRISLLDVMCELDVSCNRLLSNDGKSGQIVQLLTDRDRIGHEIRELSSLTADYGRLAAQHNSVEHEIGRLQEEKTRLQHETRSIEIALGIRPRWQVCTELESRFASMQCCAEIPQGAVARLERMDAALEKHKNKISRLVNRRRVLREDLRRLEINDELCRQSVRIEALAEQENWLDTLDNRCAELELEIEKIQEDLAVEYKSLGLKNEGTPIGVDIAALKSLDRRRLREMTGPQKAIRRAREELVDARQAIQSAEGDAQNAQRQIQTELASRGQSDLSMAIEHSGELVAQFRRRAQLDERHKQMSQYQTELEEQTRRLVTRQVLPAWTLVGLGGVLVVGAILLLAGMFASSTVTGGFGWLMVTIGLLGMITGIAAKFFIEQSNAKQLEASQKQLHMLRLQLQEAVEQRDQLDAALPGRGTPIEERIATAEGELAALERLMPLDAERQSAMREAEAARSRAVQAQENMVQAQRHWREALQAAGFPDRLTPKQVRLFSRRRDRLEELDSRLQRCREELKQRGEELSGLSNRIYQLAADTGVSVDGEPPSRLLARLLDQLKQQQSLLAQRQAVREQVAHLRRLRGKHEKSIRKLLRHRLELFKQAGANDEQEFRHLAAQRADAEAALKELETLRGEIDAAVGDHCAKSEIATLLEKYPNEELETRWERASRRLEEIEAAVRDRYEKRGRLTEKMNLLAKDRRLSEKQLELSVVKKRLKDTVRRWRVLAVCCRVLQNIRQTYERDRQPAALQEASVYLGRLTRGRYTRVWTPLGEDVLHVDDAEGNSLSCEVLSRGTREQLFLSLRLALVNSYAQRGAKLPIVLDDVLVNFDTPRAKAAAEVLADFAREGHQLLVFTCHDHILKIFRSLQVRVARLPDNSSTSDEQPDIDADKSRLSAVEHTAHNHDEELDDEPVKTPRRRSRPSKTRRKNKNRKRTARDKSRHEEDDPIESAEDDQSLVDEDESERFDTAEISDEPDDDAADEQYEYVEYEEDADEDDEINDAA